MQPNGDATDLLDPFAAELREFARQWLPVRGVIVSTEGASALVGRKIVKRGDILELALDEDLEKRLPARLIKEGSSFGTSTKGNLSKARVLESRVDSIEADGILLLVYGLRKPLLLPFKKEERPLSSPISKR
jgi:hypothetical protein